MSEVLVDNNHIEQSAATKTKTDKENEQNLPALEEEKEIEIIKKVLVDKITAVVDNSAINSEDVKNESKEIVHTNNSESVVPTPLKPTAIAETVKQVTSSNNTEHTTTALTTQQQLENELKLKQEECNHLHEQITQYEAQVSYLVQREDEINAETEITQKSKETLENKIIELEKIIKINNTEKKMWDTNMTNKTKGWEDEKKKLIDSNNTLQKQVALIKPLEEANKKLTDTNRSLENLVDRIQTLEEEKKKVSDHNSTLQKQVDQLKQSESDDSIHAKKISELSESLKLQLDRVSELEKEKVEYEQRITQLDAQIEQLKATHLSEQEHLLTASTANHTASASPSKSVAAEEPHVDKDSYDEVSQHQRSNIDEETVEKALFDALQSRYDTLLAEAEALRKSFNATLNSSSGSGMKKVPSRAPLPVTTDLNSSAAILDVTGDIVVQRLAQLFLSRYKGRYKRNMLTISQPLDVLVRVLKTYSRGEDGRLTRTDLKDALMDIGIDTTQDQMVIITEHMPRSEDGEILLTVSTVIEFFKEQMIIALKKAGAPLPSGAVPAPPKRSSPSLPRRPAAEATPVTESVSPYAMALDGKGPRRPGTRDRSRNRATTATTNSRPSTTPATDDSNNKSKDIVTRNPDNRQEQPSSSSGPTADDLSKALVVPTGEDIDWAAVPLPHNWERRVDPSTNRVSC